MLAVPAPLLKLEEVAPETEFPDAKVVVEIYPPGKDDETAIVTAPAGSVRPRLRAATEKRENRLDFDIG